MVKSIKLNNDIYWDISGIQCPDQQRSLKKYLNKQNTFVLDGAVLSSYPRYFLLARLPATSTSSRDSLHLSGFLGSWISDGKCTFDIIISNRNGLVVRGYYSGFAAAWNNCYFVVYTEDSGVKSVYFVQNNTYVGGCVINVNGDGLYSNNCKTTAVTPTGTLSLTINSENLVNLQGIATATKVIDYTNKITYSNSTYNRGKVYKVGNICYWSLNVTATATSSWGTLLNIPSDIYPMQCYDNGIPLGAYWIYGTGAGNGAGNVRANITSGTNYSIVGCYICAN